MINESWPHGATSIIIVSSKTIGHACPGWSSGFNASI
jgi:formylmethanofuran dehydrogenase subunit E-like metal-binding protein